MNAKRPRALLQTPKHGFAASRSDGSREEMQPQQGAPSLQARTLATPQNILAALQFWVRSLVSLRLQLSVIPRIPC